jgi:hypothetical protein
MNALSDLQADLDDLSLSSACRAFVYSQMGGGEAEARPAPVAADPTA